MKAINEIEWGEFYIKDIFSRIQRGKRLKTEDHIKGCIPYVSSTAMCNGVDSFIGNEKGVRVFSDCLTLANSGSVGATFYHPYSFVASDHVTELNKNGLTKYTYLFIATIVSRIASKYSFNREVNDKRIQKERILLPITKKGDPDYAYMEEYMREKERLIFGRYKKYLLQIIDNQYYEWGGVKLLNEVRWRNFMLGELFDFEKGNQNNMSALSYGAIPLVSAKKDNNGYKAFVGNNDKKCFGGCRLTLNNDGDGGAGIAYYQPKDFMLDSHVTALNHKQAIDKYALLYMSYCITKQRSKFGHGYPITGKRLHTFRIMLPVDRNGNPDYDYMGAYMRNEEIKCLKRYLDYLEKTV